MVISVILIQHFPYVTEFRAIGIFENFDSCVHRHLNTGTNKITGNFPSKFFMTEIHRESHCSINMHTITISHNLVFFMPFSHDHIASETT